MLLEHERHYGLGSNRTHWNTNGIMVWAWMLWLSHSLEHKRNYGLGMHALVIALTGLQTELWFGHGCSGERMLLEHERNYGLGMDVLYTLRDVGSEG